MKVHVQIPSYKSSTIKEKTEFIRSSCYGTTFYFSGHKIFSIIKVLEIVVTFVFVNIVANHSE